MITVENTIQLNCNLIHVCGSWVKKLRVNLHDVLQTGAGTHFTCVSQPGTRFDTSFLGALVLTIIQTTDAATLFVHSSL